MRKYAPRHIGTSSSDVKRFCEGCGPFTFRLTSTASVEGCLNANVVEGCREDLNNCILSPTGIVKLKASHGTHHKPFKPGRFVHRVAFLSGVATGTHKRFTSLTNPHSISHLIVVVPGHSLGFDVCATTRGESYSNLIHFTNFFGSVLVVVRAVL